LTPFRAQKWSFETAAHLLNRAGFGGTPGEIESARKDGLETAVHNALYLPGEPTASSDESHSWAIPTNLRNRQLELRNLEANPIERRKMIQQWEVEQRDETAGLRFWWLNRMKETAAPLVEKMTLFWHGHFATSAAKVRNAYWMWLQNETFRRNALGNFEILLKEISRDPAMMIFLDLAQSLKKHPNENWAREAMELFTLGIGHYTEQDIRQSARAFTGYRIDLTSQRFRYAPGQHDPGRKSFMGRSGNFSGDDILDIILQQPACPQLIGRKLWRFFVEDEPPPEMVAALADALRRNDFELRPVLREMFSSAEFYSARVVRSQIKSPVQFLVQTCKLLETELPPWRVTQSALQQLGQLPLAPPNVKGWDGGKSWISTSTLLFRYNFTNYLLNGTANRPLAPVTLRRAPVDLSKIIPGELRDRPEELVANLARRLFQIEPTAKQTETFLAYLKTRAPDQGDETMRGLLHLMMSTPQYQLT
jgi:uncharacterized protein (DUF1800 family)